MNSWFKDALAQPLATLKVLAKAWPAWAGALTAVLTAVATEVVPMLPEHWAFRVAAWVALGLAAIAAVSKAVSKVTPVLYPSEEGLLPLPEVAMEFDKTRLDTGPSRTHEVGDPGPRMPEREVRLPPAGGRRTPRRG